MGIWNHMDLQLLDDVDDMLGYGILDEEEDAVLIAALRAVGDLEVATAEQQALYSRHIGRLMTELEEERDAEWLEYQINKDD